MSGRGAGYPRAGKWGETVKGSPYDPCTFQINWAIVRKSVQVKQFMLLLTIALLRSIASADFELDGICNYICRLQSEWKKEKFSYT